MFTQRNMPDSEDFESDELDADYTELQDELDEMGVDLEEFYDLGGAYLDISLE